MSLSRDSGNIKKMGIVVTADGKAPHEDTQGSQAGGSRIWIADLYGPDVNPRDIPFSMPLNGGSQSGNLATATQLEPGTMVTVDLLDPKTGFCHITGVMSAVRQQGGSNMGNMAISNMWEKMANVELGVNIPPKVVETVVGGAKVRQIKEKGQRHKYTLMNGLPSHGSVFQLAGMHLPGINGIGTASQPSMMMLSDSILSMLPGVSMSLGGLFDMIAGPILDDLLSFLPPELQAGLGSMTTLLQSIEGGTGGGFMTSSRVNPEVFMLNAVGLLKETRNLSDLMSTFTRLQTDTSLFGLDTLGSISIPIPTPFGEIGLSIDAFGSMVPDIPDVVKLAMDAHDLLMGAADMFPSALPGQAFFGGNGANVNKMLQRLPGAAIATATAQLQNAVASGSGERSRINSAMKNAINGGGNALSYLGL